MAMNKGLKIAIGVATIGVVGVGIYFLYTKVIKPKLDKNKKPTGDINDLEQADTKVVKAPTYSKRTPTPSVKVPFKNKTEGDRFRNWVNDNYPDYAKNLFGDGLGRTGSYDNKYMKDAWKNYGKEYQEEINDAKSREPSGLKVGDYVRAKRNSSITKSKQQTYSRPTFLTADYRKRAYAVPQGNIYKVVKLGKDGTNLVEMAYIFNKSDKPTSSWTQGRGFQVYSKYLEKVKV